MPNISIDPNAKSQNSVTRLERLQMICSLAVGNSPVIVAFAFVGKAAVVIGIDILWVQLDGPAKFGDGPLF